MGTLMWDSSGSLTFNTWDSSLGVTTSTTGMYGIGGCWDSCPFFALSILQHVGRLEVGTHFWRRYDTRVQYSAEVSWKESSAELVGTRPLEFWLEDSQNAKISWSQRNLLVPTCTYGRWDSLVAKVWSLANALLEMSRVWTWIQSVLSWKQARIKQTKSDASSVGRSGTLEGTLCL